LKPKTFSTCLTAEVSWYYRNWTCLFFKTSQVIVCRLTFFGNCCNTAQF